MNRHLLNLNRIPINSRLVFIGCSTTCLSSIQYLLFQNEYNFSNITIIDPQIHNLVNEIHTNIDSTYYPSDLHYNKNKLIQLNLANRIQQEIISIRPVEDKVNINIVNNPRMDSWHGMREMLLSVDWRDLNEFYCTRAEYLECGGDYLKEHKCSNRYIKTPINPNQAEEDAVAAAKRRKR